MRLAIRRVTVFTPIEYNGDSTTIAVVAANPSSSVCTYACCGDATGLARQLERHGMMSSTAQSFDSVVRRGYTHRLEGRSMSKQRVLHEFVSSRLQRRHVLCPK